MKQLHLVLASIVGVAIVALWGAIALINDGQAEYAAAVVGASITALAWLMKALTDPEVPMVPASVVMAIVNGAENPAGDGKRFEVRPNAMACLGVILMLGGFGGYLLHAAHPELGYAVIALAIGAAATTLSDLVKPADKDVPMPIVEQLVARLGPPVV